MDRWKFQGFGLISICAIRTTSYDQEDVIHEPTYSVFIALS